MRVNAFVCWENGDAPAVHPLCTPPYTVCAPKRGLTVRAVVKVKGGLMMYGGPRCREAGLTPGLWFW